MLFVLAAESVRSANFAPGAGIGTVEIPIFFKVAVRRISIVLCEIVLIDGLREALDLRFRKRPGEY